METNFKIEKFYFRASNEHCRTTLSFFSSSTSFIVFRFQWTVKPVDRIAMSRQPWNAYFEFRFSFLGESRYTKLNKMTIHTAQQKYRLLHEVVTSTHNFRYYIWKLMPTSGAHRLKTISKSITWNRNHAKACELCVFACRRAETFNLHKYSDWKTESTWKPLD